MRKVALMLATVTLIVSAQRASADDAPPQPVQVVASVMQLSDVQLASWLQILHAREEALQPLQQQRQVTQQEIEKALQAPTPDAPTIGQLVIQARGLETQIAAVVAQAETQFEQLLTTDQRDRLQQIRAVSHVCPVVPAFAATGLL